MIVVLPDHTHTLFFIVLLPVYEISVYIHTCRKLVTKKIEKSTGPRSAIDGRPRDRMFDPGPDPCMYIRGD